MSISPAPCADAEKGEINSRDNGMLTLHKVPTIETENAIAAFAASRRMIALLATVMLVSFAAAVAMAVPRLASKTNEPAQLDVGFAKSSISDNMIGEAKKIVSSSCPPPVNVKVDFRVPDRAPEKIDPKCWQAPTSIRMFYRGGSCDSNHVDSVPSSISSDFECQDFNGGPLPHGGEDDETTAYIRVTSLMTSESSFEGTVHVHDVYQLSNGSGEPIQGKQTIEIFTDSAMETLLQIVKFTANCSANSKQQLALATELGANEVIEFSNPLQGTVSFFAPQLEIPPVEVVLMLSIPFEDDADDNDSSNSIIIRELSLMTNYTEPSLVDLSSTVHGAVLRPSNPQVEISIDVQLDYTVSHAYETLSRGYGSSITTGEKCRFADYDDSIV